MCRLAMMNNEGISYIERHYGLENLFDYLEMQLGGHGNGVCIIYNDGSYYINKGVNLNNKAIVDTIMDEISDIKWVIYHTRLASVGNVSDSNCHPFEDKGRVIAMNGTERNYTVVSKFKTDTENILLSTDDIMEGTKKYNSVFLGYENGKVFANRNNGSLECIILGNGGKIFASTFPNYYYDNEAVYVAPPCFVEGKNMKPLVNAQKKWSYNGRWNGYAW